jgi:cob(I)alamin adenosyltransferase
LLAAECVRFERLGWLVVKIYTRKGDDGTTSLWYGGRVPKSDRRTEAYGTLDEAASALGIARSLCSDPRLGADILRVQNELFVAGAELATAPEARERLEDGVSRMTEEMVSRLESDIDFYMGAVDLPPKFVIPGGTQLSAQLDLARAVLRRAERRIVGLRDAGGLGDSSLLGFVNRASDLLFAMARFADEREPELFEGRARSPEERA